MEGFLAIEFNPKSNVSLNSVNLNEECIVMLVSISKYEQLMQIISVEFVDRGKKEKWHVFLELSNSAQHNKRTIIVVIETEKESCLKEIKREEIAYENDNNN